MLNDAAHNNFHTGTGRCCPFADGLHSDRYVVASNEEPLSKKKLADADVLVIANALHERNQGNWTLYRATPRLRPMRWRLSVSGLKAVARSCSSQIICHFQVPQTNSQALTAPTS